MTIYSMVKLTVVTYSSAGVKFSFNNLDPGIKKNQKGKKSDEQ